MRVTDPTAAEELTGLVFDIQRYALHDGPGIRTLVFLKGCPLHCAWCQNPESLDPRPEIGFLAVKCIECGACFDACPQDAIDLESDGRIIRDRCDRCGLCVDECVAEALSVIGEEYTVDRLLAEVERDRAFYEQSGGGVTLSGGEPLRQRRFLAALLPRLKAAGLHTAIETCGHFVWADVEALLHDVDLVYFDLKLMDRDAHKNATGVDNRVILENARRLVGEDLEVVFRCPLIPGYSATETNVQALVDFLLSLGQDRVHLLPYHSLGEGKLQRIDSPLPPLELPPLAQAEIEDIAAQFEFAGIHTVIGGS